MFDMSPDLTQGQDVLRRPVAGPVCLPARLHHVAGDRAALRLRPRRSATPGGALADQRRRGDAGGPAVLLRGHDAVRVLPPAPGAAGFPKLDKQDQLLPYFVLTELRCSGMTGLLWPGCSPP